MADRRFEQLTPVFGVAAVLVTFGTMGAAIAVSPAFSPTVNALSDLGDASTSAGTATTELLFNGGLMVGGVLGIGFAVGLAVLADHLLQRVGAVVFAVSMASMAGVGFFPQDGPYHFEVASGFYMLFSVALLIYGPGQLLLGRRQEALLSLSAAVGNLAVWIYWGATGGLSQPGLAVPELIGAALLAVWVVVTVAVLRQDGPTPQSDPFSWGS